MMKSNTEPKACCDTCNAFFVQTADQGVCRANPPQVVMVGVKQMPGLEGISGPTLEPQCVSVFPPMRKSGKCRAWEPDEKTEKALEKLALHGMRTDQLQALQADFEDKADREREFEKAADEDRARAIKEGIERLGKVHVRGNG